VIPRVSKRLVKLRAQRSDVGFDVLEPIVQVHDCRAIPIT